MTQETKPHWVDYGSFDGRYQRSAEEKQARDASARMYRMMRHDNPAAARLAYKRIKAARDAFHERFFGGTGVALWDHTNRR